MSKSVYVYAALLALSLGAAWNRYTGGEPVEKEGVQLIDARATDLEKVVYTAPDLTVTFEMKTDDFGRYGWATVDEHKKGKDDAPPPPAKVTTFKTGSAADKLVEAFAPMFALREITAKDDAQLTSFGLKEPDTTVAVTAGGRTLTFDLGGETYGTKDRYARNQADGRIYVLDDEPFKSLKFAATRLPERALVAAKLEAMSGASLGVGGATAAWTQKNRDDKAAAYWERDGGTGKDESFGNWLDKALKLKSTAYVQPGEEPAELLPAFDLTVRADDLKPETVSVLVAGEDYYARSGSTRGLVKLSRGPAKDAAEDAKDVAEGKAPAPAEATAPPGAAAPSVGAPPTGEPGGAPPAGAPPALPPPNPGALPRPGVPAPPGK